MATTNKRLAEIGGWEGSVANHPLADLEMGDRSRKGYRDGMDERKAPGGFVLILFFFEISEKKVDEFFATRVAGHWDFAMCGRRITRE